MKLRLPHKFQAALIAAIASVSITTLSTGTTAQAWTAQTSTASEYVSTTANYTQYGWNYNAETGEITAPNNIWDSFTFKLNNTYLSGHSGNEQMLYVTPAKAPGTTWGFYATGTGITGLWQGKTWTTGGTIAQGTLSPLADGEGKIILTAKINTGGTYLYKGVGTASTNQIYGRSDLRSTGAGDVIKLTLSKNLVDSFLVSHTSATVTQNDGTVKNYAWAYEQASGRSATMRTDTGYNAYIVRSGAEAWFASGTGTVNIAGDLYVEGTYSDGYGALRLGTDANGVLNLDGGLYLGADSVICSDSEGTAKRGTINFNGDVVGSDYTLTLAVKRNNGSDMVFNNTVNLGGLVSQSTLTFGSQAVATVGDVTFTTAGRTYANDGDLTINGTANLGTAFTNTGDLTLNGTATLGGVLTNTGTLTLNGTVALGSGLSIVNNTDGVVDLLNGVVFDLTNVQAETSGDTKTYTLFTGSKNVDLTSLNGDTVTDHITGTTAAGHTWAFTSDGKLVSTIVSRELMWVSYGPGTWTSQDDSQTPWALKNELSTTYFHNGDSVTFSYVTGDEQATLGSDVEALKMTLDTDTPDVTINNGGSYNLHVETLDIKSGHLTTNAEMTVNEVTIEAGGVWNMGGHLDLTAITYSNAGTLNVMSGAAVTISKDTDTSAVTGAGTLNLSVGTEVIQGYAPTFKAGSPFTGTLVYNEGDIANHNSYVTLDNTFAGTLELHGRMNGRAMNLGGATTLRLVGDRSGNTTGLWSQGGAINLPALEVTGNNTVDLWSDGGTIINGTVNSGTNRQGHLNKRENGTMTFNGAVALAEYTTPGGTVNFNSSADLDRININGGTVNLAGGADADYNLGDIYLYSGSLAIGNNGVKSISANEFRVSCTTTLTNAAEAPAVFNVVQLDVSNFQTNFTLSNVELNVSGRATAAELRTDRNADEATVTVGSNATLNLNGGVEWRKQDTAHSKLDYVNLTIANGGTVAITGAENVLNALTIERGGSLTFGAGTSTTVEDAATISEVITALGDITLNGNVNIDGMDDTELTTYVYGKENGNGFKQYGGSLTVVNTTGGGSVSVKEGTVITFKDASGTLDSTGKFTLDNSTVHYDTFCVVASGTSESLTYALSQAEGHGTMTTVQLADGTGLDLDSADAELQHLVLKDGASATLNVTQSATISSVEGLGAAQALNVTGTAGKVLAISTTETVAGMLSVTGVTLKLDTNLTLAGGLDNAGTINLEGKKLTLNGQAGGTAYNLGTITGNDSTNLFVNANANAVFTGNATMHHLESATGSSVTVAETATLTFTNTANRTQAGNYNTFYGLDNQGTISIKSGNGDLRFWGTRNDQVFNVGHLHIDGTNGTSYMLTAGAVNYTTDIVVKNLSGGSASHTLQVSDCYNGGTQGQVIDFIIGEAQDHNNLYEGKIQYGIGTGSALAGSGMHLVIKDDLVASKAVLDAIFSGNNAQSATITVDTAHAKVKGLTGTASATKSMHVSGKKDEGSSDNRVLEIVGDGSSYTYNYGGKLGANLDVVHSGTGTQSFGGVDGFNGSVDVEAGVLNIMNAASVNVQDVTIAANGTLGVYNGTTATAETASEGTLTMKSDNTLKAGGTNATLNANLVMEAGSTLDVSATGGAGLLMGSSVTLNPGVTLSAGDMAAITDLGFMDQYTLFTGVDAFSYNGNTPISTPIAFDSETWVKASEVFSNSEFSGGKDYYVFYSGAQNGSNVGAVYVMQLPEPTTGTLSLLALAALAARRRRK